ncbi:MAG: hypothetical protein ABIL07_02010 [candidate division WOR-3 bacterium]
MTKEEKFYKALQDVFIVTRIDDNTAVLCFDTDEYNILMFRGAKLCKTY